MPQTDMLTKPFHSVNEILGGGQVNRIWNLFSVGQGATIIIIIETVFRDSDVKAPDMGGSATTERFAAQF